MRKPRRYGKKDVKRVTVTVSINDVDHPALYEAIVSNQMSDEARRIFTSASSFLAAHGNAALLGTNELGSIIKDIFLKLEDVADKLDNVKFVEAKTDTDLDEVFIDFS